MLWSSESLTGAEDPLPKGLTDLAGMLVLVLLVGGLSSPPCEPPLGPAKCPQDMVTGFPQNARSKRKVFRQKLFYLCANL